MRTCIIVIACLVVATLMPSRAQGAYPTSISVQGKLTDVAGVPLAAGFKNMTFRIFANASGGTQLWPDNPNEAQSINSDANGLWTAFVGAVQHLSPGVFSDTLRWLEISVNGTVLPRVRIVTSPSALQVASVDGATGGVITTGLRVGTSNNQASGDGSLATGSTNSAAGNYSAVCGGHNNTASKDDATVIGGNSNAAGGEKACVAGGSNNVITNIESFIGGGTFNIDSGAYNGIIGGAHNTAVGYYQSVVGGIFNRVQAGNYSCIAGALYGVAAGTASFIGGGNTNAVYGDQSVALGGQLNVATGDNSLAAGNYAYADNDQCFVWNDGTNPLHTNANNSFLVRASGGVTFISNSSSTQGVWLFANSSGWSGISDSTMKENRQRIDGDLLLKRLGSIPIDSWNYKAQGPSIRHIGPMAQDFHTAFQMGENERFINSMDADGVALAAIQALYKRNQELESSVEKLQSQIEKIKATLAAAQK